MKLFQLAFFLLITIDLFAQLNNPRNVEYHWQTDTTQRAIDLSEISVVLPRHSFPTIDYPTFIGKTEGLQQYFLHEPVIVVAINGQSKAYPLNVLTMHEISNDTLGGVPILPTYCPLCNASVVYDRRVTTNNKEQVLEFEVSGMLRHSDMVMADKQTETWWQQLTGTGLVGELTTHELTVIPSLVISLEDYFNTYPDGVILSPNTQTTVQDKYGTNPYVGYDDLNSKPYGRYFSHDKLNYRLPPMERVVDLESNNKYKVYPYSALYKEGIINDYFEGKNVVLFYKPGMVSVLDEGEIEQSKSIGSVTIFSSIVDGNKLIFKKKKNQFIDTNTKSVWNITGKCISGELKGKQLTPEKSSNHFAFAWLQFYPNTEIYGEIK